MSLTNRAAGARRRVGYAHHITSVLANVMRTRLVAVIVAAALVALATASPAPADPPGFDAGAGFPTVGNFNPSP